MGFRDDHHALEMDRLLLGQRVGKAIQRENRTSLGHHGDFSRERKRAIRSRFRLPSEPHPRRGPTLKIGKAAKRRERILKVLIQRDGNWCTYCGVMFEPMRPPTIDHITPRSRGGTSLQSNLALACETCNEAKGGAHRRSQRASFTHLDGQPSRPGQAAWRSG